MSPIHRIWRLSKLCWVPCLLLLSATNVLADIAPAELQNRTIVVSWTANNSLRSDRGEIISRTVQVKRQIYVSSAGRTFTRFEANSGSVSRTREFDPDEGPDSDRREMRFEGNKLVQATEFTSGAAQIVISFAPDYSSCTVDVTFGRSGSEPIRRRGLNGGMFELLKSDISRKNCSIQNGNAFAR